MTVLDEATHPLLPTTDASGARAARVPAGDYLRGLRDARAAVATVAAGLAMNDEVARCAGASRAFEAVDDLIAAFEP
ncbi:hypothetical protein [Leifsonia poae]|uniref:hypothetical protein n=1 Tax=Leifsonia poae TaxID=110933 RepID=UPI001CC02C3E|nr:hypothetical protein [Leifsonia poae]